MSIIRIRMAAAFATLVLASAPPSLTWADDPALGEQLVDVMVELFGNHPGQRTMHAKGIVVEGTFSPTGAGEALTTAALFHRGPPVSVTARFSDATGLPAIPDGDPNANPHGFALQFHLDDGSEFDLVTNSLKMFPVATGEEFLQLLKASLASGPDAAKPTTLDQFAMAHPTVAQAFGTVATPASYSREAYNGINAFVFVGAAGERRPFRFRIDPVAGVAHLSKEEAAEKAPDFLSDELRSELSSTPVRFRLLAQLAEPGDRTDDPSVPWPEDRKLVDLGEIAITDAVPDNETAEKRLMLLPGNLPNGIEPSDDPMIDVRNETYAVSFARRSE